MSPVYNFGLADVHHQESNQNESKAKEVKLFQTLGLVKSYENMSEAEKNSIRESSIEFIDSINKVQLRDADTQEITTFSLERDSDLLYDLVIEGKSTPSGDNEGLETRSRRSYFFAPTKVGNNFIVFESNEDFLELENLEGYPAGSLKGFHVLLKENNGKIRFLNIVVQVPPGKPIYVLDNMGTYLPNVETQLQVPLSTKKDLHLSTDEAKYSGIEEKSVIPISPAAERALGITRDHFRASSQEAVSMSEVLKLTETYQDTIKRNREYLSKQLDAQAALDAEKTNVPDPLAGIVIPNCNITEFTNRLIAIDGFGKSLLELKNELFQKRKPLVDEARRLGTIKPSMSYWESTLKKEKAANDEAIRALNEEFFWYIVKNRKVRALFNTLSENGRLLSVPKPDTLQLTSNFFKYFEGQDQSLGIIKPAEITSIHGLQILIFNPLEERLLREREYTVQKLQAKINDCISEGVKSAAATASEANQKHAERVFDKQNALHALDVDLSEKSADAVHEVAAKLVGLETGVIAHTNEGNNVYLYNFDPRNFPELEPFYRPIFEKEAELDTFVLSTSPPHEVFGPGGKGGILTFCQPKGTKRCSMLYFTHEGKAGEKWPVFAQLPLESIDFGENKDHLTLIDAIRGRAEITAHREANRERIHSLDDLLGDDGAQGKFYPFLRNIGLLPDGFNEKLEVDVYPRFPSPEEGAMAFVLRSGSIATTNKISDTQELELLHGLYGVDSEILSPLTVDRLKDPGFDHVFLHEFIHVLDKMGKLNGFQSPVFNSGKEAEKPEAQEVEQAIRRHFAIEKNIVSFNSQLPSQLGRLRYREAVNSTLRGLHETGNSDATWEEAERIYQKKKLNEYVENSLDPDSTVYTDFENIISYMGDPSEQIAWHAQIQYMKREKKMNQEQIISWFTKNAVDGKSPLQYQLDKIAYYFETDFSETWKALRDN